MDYIDKNLNEVSYEDYMRDYDRQRLMAALTLQLAKAAYDLGPERRTEFSPQEWSWLALLANGLTYKYYGEEIGRQDHDAIWTFMRRDMAPLKQKVDQLIERRYPS